MARITPPIGTEGLLLVGLPWVLNPSLSYKVEAHRTFEDLVRQKDDVFKMVYTPVGLGQLEYEKDVAAGALIVTLSNPTVKPIYIPDTYIQAYTGMAVVPHSWLAAIVNCGILPDTWDTAGLTQALQATVSDYTGVQSTVTISRAPTTDAVTQEQYIQLQAARQAAIKNRTSFYAENQSLKAEVTRLNSENDELYAIIAQMQAELDAR